jgi:DNA-directed RNA polymerase subunit RPC12/RpoP
MIKTSTLRLQVICPGCNSYHALNGITDFDTCQNCGRSINIRTILHEKLFDLLDRVQYLNGFLSGNIEQIGSGGYKLAYSSIPPVCEECREVLETELILAAFEAKKPIVCPKCSHKMPVRPADATIREFHPKAIGVINDSLGKDSNEKNTDKNEVLVFKCMTCGAGLELTADTGRTMKCGYCDNENYLPDSIWTKLHPHKEVQPLYLILKLTPEDINSTVDHFLRVTALAIYDRHFTNFIKEYFERPFVSESLLEWIKALVSAKGNEQVNFNMDIDKVRKILYDNLNLGSESLPDELLAAAAENSRDIPKELQLKLSKHKSEKVRIALSKNPGLSREIYKVLQNDKSEAVQAESRKHKSGLLSRLFG